MSFAKQSGTPDQGTGGNNQKPLLLVLLVLVAVFAYLYFFTGIIRPRPEEQSAPPPVAEVKKPLPPRPEGQPTPSATPAANAPGGVSAAEKTTVAAAKPAEAPVQAAAAKAESKPAPAAPAKDAVKPAAQVKVPEKPAAATAAKKPETAAKKTETAVKKTETAARKSETAAKSDAKSASGAEPVKTAVKKDEVHKETGKATPSPVAAAAKKGDKKKVPAATSTPVTLLVGEFVPDREFLELEARLKKMGLSPLKRSELKKARPMNRLFVGEYPDYEAGAAMLERVKKASGDAFFIENKGAYRVYAGSYYSSAMAGKVKDGLAAKGIAVTMQKADVPVAVVRLTAGRFTDKAAAASAVRKLKAAGMSPTVVKLGM